ncbi:protocatechuate 3,4-dioxygenase subunit alpha [Mycobacterium gastri]|uniref:Protocatechuate 3,4-dioxygenase subunit alpha n=1 Tax=Mycobacterium gastri TaxID=1777 RepID=A0A1X1UZF5_MYCGS|nr:protocatechuate 3,4-dioxygenase subunit alpha [Mycobacterium gastri]ETW21198.1 protocatechuate 3,4-dioxygenase subunit alpha [Mycobacterium gastri 'Wayne']ORV62220.1 protocatechuate 3,4-dioxygenase subunit alpha [Mycobacterium gastri]
MDQWAGTPGQTVGPFFGIALSYPGDSQLVADEHPDAIGLHGTVYDGAGVPDALLEIWQADGDGRIPRQAGSLRRTGTGLAEFTGFGRAATDADGHYRFTTVAPRSVDGWAPFFVIAVFARGLLHRLFTRAYLPSPELDADPLLARVDPPRRATLRCVDENDSGRVGYRFDIHLQGPSETVFLTYRDDMR